MIGQLNETDFYAEMIVQSESCATRQWPLALIALFN